MSQVHQIPSHFLSAHDKIVIEKKNTPPFLSLSLFFFFFADSARAKRIAAHLGGCRSCPNSWLFQPRVWWCHVLVHLPRPVLSVNFFPLSKGLECGQISLAAFADFFDFCGQCSRAFGSLSWKPPYFCSLDHLEVSISARPALPFLDANLDGAFRLGISLR